MFKVCTADEMRNIDKKAVENGISSLVLMENAGLRCVDELLVKFKNLKGLKVGIFSGKGNNGGDGFVIARQLLRLGAIVDVFTVLGRDFSPDARVNFNLLQSTDCSVMENTEFPEYEIPLYDIVIDAIFGTGIKGAVSGDIADTIEAINRNARFIMSVDVPSGINADTGEVLGACIKADMTVTFQCYKRGLLLYPAADFTGEIKCVDICIPNNLTEDIKINVTDLDFAKSVFPKRYDNSQKGDYGKVLIIAGSLGMSGAAYLSGEACIRSGSGLVTVLCPDVINPVLEQKTTEVMTHAVKSYDGKISKDAIPEIVRMLPRFDVVLFGPGVGRNPDIDEVLKAVIKNCEVPLIIDADGLFALSKNPDIISECRCSLILTPHEMEMSRLTGKDISYIKENRLLVAKEFSEENGVTLILKGHHTIVTSTDSMQYINIKGNSGMATGGSGDVLAGICASLLARGITDDEASALSVLIHSLAGDLAKERYGENSVTATGILECIPDAIRGILR